MSTPRDPLSQHDEDPTAELLVPATRGRRVSAAAPTVVDVVKPLPDPANRAKLA